MSFPFMICQRFAELLRASLKSLLGACEVLGDPLGVLWRPLRILRGPRWSIECDFGSLGGPRRPQGMLGEGPEVTDSTEGFLRVSGGEPEGPLE